MTMKTILGAAALCACGALAAAQPADAPGMGGPGKGGRGGFMAERMSRALNLNEEQKAAFQKTLEQQRPQMQALHQQLRDNHQKLEAALAGANPEPAAVGQLVIQANALRKQAEALREQASQALRATLTPEQQARFDALQSLREEGGFGPGGPGFGPRGFGHRGHRGTGGSEPPPPPQQ